MIRGILPGMRERKWGRIVAITSVSVYEPIPGLALSNAYRPGLTGLLKTIATEVAGDGVTVNSVCPGYTATERLEELAGATARREGKSSEEVVSEWAASIPAGRLGTARGDRGGGGLPGLRSRLLHHGCGAPCGWRPAEGSARLRPRISR